MAILMSPQHQEEKENKFFAKLNDSEYRKKMLKKLRIANAIFYYLALLFLLLPIWFHLKGTTTPTILSILHFALFFFIFEMTVVSILILIIRVYEKTLNLSS